MKNKGIIIAVVLLVLGIVVYFLLNKKSATASNTAITTTQESNTGVSALFNTGAMTSLFGGVGKVAGAVTGGTKPTTTTPTSSPENMSTALNISSMVGGW